MKQGLHPDYTPTKVLCACGNLIETRSTRGDFHVDICNACHPFFTGKQKLMDTAGRIEKFKTRYAGSPEKAEKAPKAAAPAAEAPKKAPAPKENRAAKRAKVNAGKPKPQKTEAVEAAPEAKPEGETA
ncbi:MAG TPA: 50S ribosomal protein L31 [Anaeromyxobacteraceae bacterium]|jgi:large subunit ribosomal protein L31|nr:50S ribosomal protein L31 [Anaeromyxobacteraceae bacterium]